MSGLFIARIDVTDPEKYKAYQKLAQEAVAAYGGEFLTRGGDITTMEGPEETRRVVVVRFPSAERAQEFYRSPEYSAAKAERENAADFHAIVAEGAVGDSRV